MKLRWREHELIFVTVLVVASVMMLIWELYNSPASVAGSHYAIRFKENGFPFVFWRNVLLPQVAIILLLFIVYLLVNLLLIPSIKKISFTDIEKLAARKIMIPVVLIVAAGFLLAFGVNLISCYARPHLFNYGNYHLLALFGYNDNPLTNVFFGFDRAISFVLLLTAVLGLRELIIWLITKPGPKREFNVLVANSTTPLLFVFFLIPFFINPVHADFKDYLAWTTPVLLLYVYQTFWFFPFRESRGWLNRPVLLRLLLSTFAGAVFSAIVFSGSGKLLEGFAYWLFLLLIVTPLVWLLFQQRKDRILQLTGMETALARSTTDLQFLRSQINPHFLFNALNTLYGTALKENSEKTAEGIQMLGDMMRFMLHDNHLDEIPMEKEIGYLKNYIALQKLRLPASSNILIEENISDVKCKGSIAPMLLIPFIENAFKHGISLTEKSWIRINVVCTGVLVSLEVCNSTHALAETDPEKDKSGVGLKNVADRLRLLYPGKHEIFTEKRENEFIAKLLIKQKQ